MIVASRGRQTRCPPTSSPSTPSRRMFALDGSSSQTSIFALQFAEQCGWSRAQVKRCSQFLGKVIRAAVVRRAKSWVFNGGIGGSKLLKGRIGITKGCRTTSADGALKSRLTRAHYIEALSLLAQTSSRSGMAKSQSPDQTYLVCLATPRIDVLIDSKYRCREADLAHFGGGITWLAWHRLRISICQSTR